MATEQGICKNCGSLLMVNSNDELCECVFCDCVFPSAEAIEIFNHPDGVEFPNLPQPKRDAKASRHTVTPVFEDVVEKAVKVDKAVNKETKVEKLFELSPDDVKTPKKVKRIVYIATAACIAVVLGISIPLCVLRTNHAKKIEKNITRCISDSQISVSTVVEDGYATGYKISGQTNNKLSLVTSDEVEKSQVLSAFESFCAIRGEEYGYSSSDGAHYYRGVVLTVYAPNGRFTIEGKKDGASEDSIELVVPEEEESESET
ncbi:MAG: hypothetical protein IK020_02740 [Clostridiales bacterium]|nr:hypothetical protein [Clostridiales bacterium]MBR5974079.1 hypothetical protein [Clostridiales bacterium]